LEAKKEQKTKADEEEKIREQKIAESHEAADQKQIEESLEFARRLTDEEISQRASEDALIQKANQWKAA
jgi:hypothetical protein